jgi:alkanesulfonate monooxygenase SsuD/methylene tetrahydromethanopterin reductase-like flavin-dependent oxidoreductase (luciferase family)
VKLGLALPLKASRGVADLASVAAAAEHSGFDSLWLGDPPPGSGGLDPIVALGALARTTETVGLGVLGLDERRRPAGPTAKQLAGLGQLLPGRLVVSVATAGAGPWFEGADQTGIPLPERAERLDDHLAVLGPLLAGDEVTHHGRHHRAEGARLVPAPVPAPAVWVSGGAGPVVEIAARRADGWNLAWRWKPSEYRRRAEWLEAACERAGRDPASVERSVGLYVLMGEDEPDLRRRYDALQKASAGALAAMPLDDFREDRLVGTVDQVADQLATWGEMGVSTVIATMGAVPFSSTQVDDLHMLIAARTRE